VLALRQGETVATAQTDGAGDFTLRVPPGGPVDVLHRGDGVSGGRRAVRASIAGVAAGTEGLVLRALPAATDRALVVRVEDDQRRALPGARVRLSPGMEGSPPDLTADAEGITKFGGLTAEPVGVLVEPPADHALAGSGAVVTLAVPAGQTLTLRVPPPLAVVGLVVDPEGRPMEGVTTFVRTRHGTATTKTGPGGEFRLLIPPDLETVQLVAHVSADGRLDRMGQATADPRAGPVRIVLRRHRGW
jgi:hypothetical protein